MTGTIFDQLDDHALQHLSGLSDQFAIKAMRLTPAQVEGDRKFWEKFRQIISNFEKYYNEKWDESKE